MASSDHEDPSLGSRPPRDEVPGDAPEGSYTYEILPILPCLPAAEVETQRACVEVRILWGHTVLLVAHLTPPRSFHVGEEAAGGAPCDFPLPASLLGTASLPLVTVEGDGRISVVLPRGAHGTLELAGQPGTSVEQAIEGGHALTCPALPDAHCVVLSMGSRATLELAGFRFEIAVGPAGRAVAGAPLLSSRGLLYAALSATLHLGLIAAGVLSSPPPDEQGYGLTMEQQMLMVRLLNTAEERESERRQAALAESDEGDEGDEGASGTRTRCEEGTMGNPSAWSKPIRPSGSHLDDAPRSVRAAALREASEFAMTTMAGRGGGAVVLGGDDQVLDYFFNEGNDSWGEEPDPFLDWAPRLSGLGEAVDVVRGAELAVLGVRARSAPRFGEAPLASSLLRRPPRLIPGAMSVAGYLSPAVIQRVLRRQMGQVRQCYEDGLRNDPALKGRVAVRFTIGVDGSVSRVANGGSDLADSGVLSCVVRSYYGMSFPRPSSGVVTVVFPVFLSPGG